MAAADQHVPVQLLDARQVVEAAGPELPERRDERLLVDVMRGEGAADRRDAHGAFSWEPV